MNSKDCEYKPSGELQGDNSPMPNKGTGTGVTDTYGADLSANADNRQGSIAGSTKSDKGDLA
jgi:hypothetical protein